jgi:uncharacterized protein (DUF305 family)
VSLLACAVLVAGCGAGDDFSEADAELVTAMVEHHAEGIQLANMTIGRRGLESQVAKLAEHIRVEQTGEIDQLASLLEEWDRPVPRTGFGTGDGHTHAAGPADAGLEALARTSDAEFEGKWLSMMVEHHEAGVRMARGLADGVNSDAARLAGRIAADREGEIERMTGWLDES